MDGPLVNFSIQFGLYLQHITHEIGHNMNMSHDFLCKATLLPKCHRFCATDSSQVCTGIGGVMSYKRAKKWSCCSNADFAELYHSLGPDFCLSPHGSGNFINKAYATKMLERA